MRNKINILYAVIYRIYHFDPLEVITFSRIRTYIFYVYIEKNMRNNLFPHNNNPKKHRIRVPYVCSIALNMFAQNHNVTKKKKKFINCVPASDKVYDVYFLEYLYIVNSTRIQTERIDIYVHSTYSQSKYVSLASILFIFCQQTLCSQTHVCELLSQITFYPLLAIGVYRIFGATHFKILPSFRNVGKAPRMLFCLA